MKSSKKKAIILLIALIAVTITALTVCLFSDTASEISQKILNAFEDDVSENESSQSEALEDTSSVIKKAARIRTTLKD